MKWPEWLEVSNRYKHLIGVAIVAAMTFVLLFMLYGALAWQQLVECLYVATAVMFAMEFKDVHHYNGDHVPIRHWDWSPWDWMDCLAGYIGWALVAMVYLIIYILTL